MFTIVSTEFIKLRRSSMIMLVFIAGFMPAVIQYLQYISYKAQNTESCTYFLASSQELMVFCTLTMLILVSVFTFSMEYQFNTASYIFTSDTSRIKIFIAKIISIFLQIILMFIVSAFSQILLGALALHLVISGDLFIKLISVTAWYIFSYFLLSIVVAMIVVLTKKFIVSAVISFGYLVITFPVHYFKNNPYINPFMTPAIVAAKLYDSNSYIFGNYYNIPINIMDLIVFLLTLAVVSLIIGLVYYKKSDAII